MNKPPRVDSVKAIGSEVLQVVWNTGEDLPVDVSRLIRRYKVYAPLRETRLFKKVRADEWGHSVLWPGNIDMSADTLYELARAQAGEWGPESFDAWMQRNGLSLSAAADALDMTRRMIAHYRTGSRPIPRVVALACEGWEARHRRRAA